MVSGFRIKSRREVKSYAIGGSWSSRGGRLLLNRAVDYDVFFVGGILCQKSSIFFVCRIVCALAIPADVVLFALGHTAIEEALYRGAVKGESLRSAFRYLRNTSIDRHSLRCGSSGLFLASVSGSKKDATKSKHAREN
jgi:hypothetical protein